MSRMIWDTIKVFVIFMVCTFLFYYGLRIMHAEYEQFHRYDSPEGPAVKAFNEDKTLLDRINLFFWLGE